MNHEGTKARSENRRDAEAQSRIEIMLRGFHEVTWDRWAGTLNRMIAFGWITRTDGKQDFVVVRIENGTVTSIITSSAKYSPIFAHRFGFDHSPCQRVEHDFPAVNSLRLCASAVNPV